MAKKFLIALLCFGLLLVVVSGSILLADSTDAAVAATQSTKILQKLRLTHGSTQTTQAPSATWDPQYLGILSIPALDLTLPVRQSWSYSQLKQTPCRQCGSIQGGDLVIAAHNYPSHFGGLSRLLPGTTLSISTGDGAIHTYILSHVQQVAANHRQAVLESKFDLVLYTCTPGGSRRVAAFWIRET